MARRPPPVPEPAASRGTRAGPDRPTATGAPDSRDEPHGLVDIEQTREQRRDRARATLGVTGESEAPPLRKALAGRGVGFYPLIAVALLGSADVVQGYGLTVLAPEVGFTLGVGPGAIGAANALKTVALTLGSLGAAALVQRRPRRGVVCVATGVVWSLLAISTGFVVSIAGLMVILSFDGLTSGSAQSVHPPLLVDSYPPEARVRALSYYTTALPVANIVGPLAVVGFVAMGLTWRGVFVALGLVSLGASILAARLRDPGFGQWDTQRLRRSVRAQAEAEAGGLSEEEVSLGFFEIARRLFLIPTIRRLLVAAVALGVLIVPFNSFLSFYLEQRWGLGAEGRGLFYAAASVVSVFALVLYAKRGEAMFRASPGRVVRVTGFSLVIGSVLIAVASLVPVFAVMVLLFSVAIALFAVLTPAITVGILSVIPAHMRAHAAALIAIFAGGVGGTFGVVFLSGINTRFGIVIALASLAVPSLIGAVAMHSTGPLVQADMDRMIDDVLEGEEIRRLADSGAHLPMLACRGVDFSYGQLQVLYDVDFTVDEGEMVALLGVNGAGKSTLLKVISGVGYPSAGSVRYRGAEITYLDAERRVKLGITQVPGGRAVFGPMSVVDNLRAFAYTLARERRAVDRALDVSFDAFPRLAERRNQAAATLSGGEQQMLGLCKALILEPRLLLIDELALGLAPVIVGQLLDMVRRINSAGTAVVLVEQSVNIALSLVDHAYFMEKGEMRFDGHSSDLLARDDLLRAVFLEGTRAGAGQ